MNRGDVHLISLPMPDRNNPGQDVYRDKYVVVLRGGPGTTNESDVPLLVASTLRVGGPPRPFEVHVSAMGGQFPVDTVIDCRWPFTLHKSQVNNYRFTLPRDIMERVSVALVSGMQMQL